MIEEQQNVHPNKIIYHQGKFESAKKSPELADLIRQNINYQHDQTIKKTLMKESMMKMSLDKDFKDLFGCYKKVDNDEQIMQEKTPDNFLQVTQEIKQICQWLEDSDQYAGMAHIPLNLYTKLFHVLHQKIDSIAIIVTQYPLYYLSKMQNLNRLSKLKWAFLNSSLDQQDKVKILEMYELKKLKLLFVTPSMLKNQTLIEFQSQLLVFCDFQHLRGEANFVNNVISRTKPGRVLGLYPTLIQNSMAEHEANNFHYINTPSPSDFNFITLKCTKQEKQKSVINYLNKSPTSIQKTLILINKKHEATSLAKKMTMDAKATVNLFDYVSYHELQAFNGNQLLNKCDKVREQQKILQSLKKIRTCSQVVISTYSDILKFQNFDLVVFYNFTDVKKFVQCCPNVKNKLLLFDEDDYHNFRNSMTSDYLNNSTLQKHIVKIIQKSQKKDSQTKKRFYSDYIDDKMLTNYSVSKQIIQKDEEKNIKINQFCKNNFITQRNFMRIIDGLVQIGMISINCKAIYQIQIQQDCLQWFRKKYPQLTQIRRKVNVLDSAMTLKTITGNLLQDFRRSSVRYKVVEEALQFRVLKNYQDVNWSTFENIVNKKLMETVSIFDYSLQILRQCAYSSIQLTRRQKVLQRKDTLLKFSLKDRKTQAIQNQQTLNDSYHKSNLLTSEIEQYLRTSEEGITDEHELVMLLQGVERSKMPKQKEEWIFGRYRKMKYEVLVQAVSKIFKNKKIKIL